MLGIFPFHDSEQSGPHRRAWPSARKVAFQVGPPVCRALVAEAAVELHVGGQARIAHIAEADLAGEFHPALTNADRQSVGALDPREEPALQG
ncbi:hypothetical protein ISU10_15675 [Nocardioides agariphilus]|uniref:Uncharacterized protein n=1 Tax=Nocardioides agariphilus TaxID=433664 RepID=A0A930VQV7_9ACTN|nr:hypothetical protein [Nocardioides agariphilus]MBF4769206.1 hypothetical protein [Nocardioides agariphilus]